MSDKMFTLSCLIFAAGIGVGIAYYRKKKNGEDSDILLKLIQLLIIFSLIVFTWANLSNSVDDLEKSVKEKKVKEELVVSVIPAGIVQGGMQTSDNSLFFPSTYTVFETNKGVYRVKGSHIVQKGLSSEVQLRGTGSKYLCVGQSYCMILRSK